MDALDSREFQSRLERLDALLQEAEQSADASAQAQIRQIVQAVIELHKAGFERILGHLDAAGEAGARVREACVQDQIISGLLLLHGLHPLELEARVLLALEQVRPYLRSHGGNVELIDLADGVVTLHLEGSCRGCPSSAITMKQTVEEAILAHAPDALGVVVEGAESGSMMTPDGQALVVLQTL
jgi:Fe-S cluster biogenesis protein NfuA